MYSLSKFVKNHSRQAVWLGVCWGLSFLLLAFAFLGGAKFTDVQQTTPDGKVNAVDLPVFQGSASAGSYRYTGKVRVGWLSPQIFQVIPDDRVTQLTINDKPVDLSQGILLGNVGNIYTGFTVDLSDQLKVGENTFQIDVWDIGGKGGALGLKINSNLVPLSVLIVLSACLLIIPFTSVLAKVLGVSSYRFVGYCLVLVGSIAQIFQVIKYNPLDDIWSDTARHWIQGVEPLRLDPMALTDPIMYQLFVGALAKLSLKVPSLVAFYVILLALVGKWFWYKFFREIQDHKTAAIYGWAAVILLPSWVGIYSYFMQETLLIATLGLALYTTWRARRKQTLNAFLLMVFCWCIAGLTRGIAIPMAAVACTWLWVVQPQKITKAALSILVLGLVLGPLVVRSSSFLNFWAPHGVGALSSVYAASGKRDIQVSYSKNGAIWTYGFACPSMGLKPFEPFSDWTSKRKGMVKVNINLDNGFEDWASAKSQNALTLKKYWWITRENIAYIFWGPSWPDTNMTRFWEASNYYFRWLWAPATLSMVFILFLTCRGTKKDWLLPSIILAWFFVQVVFPISVNEGRYRKPFEGLLIAQYVYLLGLFITTRRAKFKSEPISSEAVLLGNDEEATI